MNIAIITLGSRGDVQPYVALGKGLRLAGHEVRVVTHSPFEELVRGEGLDFASSGGDPRAIVEAHFQWKQESGRRSWLPKWFIDVRDAMRAGRGMMDAITQGMEEMAEKCWKASSGADALLLSFLGILIGVPAAKKLRIPAFAAYVMPLMPTAEFPPLAILPPAPSWLGGVRPYYNRLAWKFVYWGFWKMYEKPAEKAQRVLNMPVQSPLEQMRQLGTPMLFGYSPSFIPQPKDWPTYCHVTGYWFLDTRKDWQPPTALVDFLGAGPPPVYIGFGSMVRRDPEEMTDLVINALERAGQRGILLTGGGALSKGRGTDSIFVLDSVPHDWLFPRVAAVVHHGGAGTTGAGLRAGKPTIIIPFTADQPFWGNQVCERRLGPKPISQRHLSAETLAEAIRTAVTNKEIIASAEALGGRIRAEDGVGRAIEVLSQYLHRPG